MMESEVLQEKTGAEAARSKMLAPKLRFKGFDDGWEKKKLDEVVKIGRGKSKHRPRNASFLYGGKYPFVQTGDIKAADLYLTKYTQTYSDEGLKQSKLWNENTLCITIAANIAETAILKIKACFPDSIIGLIPKEGQTIVLFVKYLFDKFKIEIQNLSQGIAQDNLNQEKLSKIEFIFPTLPEQQKIASFLSAVDEKIQQLSRKKELLEQYKKGVMQQLFSGNLRFKDENGKEFAEWEEKRLGNFVLSHKGGAPLTPNDFTKLPGCEVIPKKGITSGGRLIIDNEEPTYCKPAFYETYAKCVIDNSYIITTLRDLVPSGPNIGYMVQYNYSNEYILAQGVYALKIDEDRLNREWIIQFSNTLEYRKIMQTIKVGSTQVHIRNEEFFKVELNLPSISEQKKIADYLSGIDNKIENVNKQISHSQMFKKGLLQQMFV